MNLTGFTVRYFTDSHSGSFIFEDVKTDAVEIFNNTTPSGREFRIGFTGVTGNSNWYFSFLNGKIYDPEGRWFAAYDDTDFNTISGNFTLTNYDYSLNGNIICATGKKAALPVDGWFAECISGCSGSSNVKIYTSPIEVKLDMRGGFYTGEIWSGSLYHTNTGSMVIRSGELFSLDYYQFMLSGTGLSFCSGNNVIPTGGYRTVYLAHTGTSDRTGLFTVGLKIYTDFGPVRLTVTGSGISPVGGTVSNSFSPTGVNITTSGSVVSGTGNYYFTTNYLNLNNASQEKPVQCQLLTTGTTWTTSFYQVTGIKIEYSGYGYIGTPTFSIIPEKDGYPVAAGYGITGYTSEITGGISGYVMTTSGIYNVTGLTGDYSVSFTGTEFSDTWTSCYALVLWDPTPIIKTTGDFVKLRTGLYMPSDSGYLCYYNNSTNLTTGTTTLGTGNNAIYLNVEFGGLSEMVTWGYVLTVSGYRDTASGTSLYSGSGLLSRIW